TGAVVAARRAARPPGRATAPDPTGPVERGADGYRSGPDPAWLRSDMAARRTARTVPRRDAHRHRRPTDPAGLDGPPRGHGRRAATSGRHRHRAAGAQPARP